MSLQREVLRTEGFDLWDGNSEIRTGLVAFHIGAVAALLVFSWKAFLLAMVLWWVAGGLGVGYHRLLTHRGYKSPKWMEYFLTVCATLALEGCPILWVATHRQHHQNTDEEGDPHSPREGSFWARVGWLLTGQTMHNDSAISCLTFRTFAKTSSTFGSAAGIGYLLPCRVWSFLLQGDGSSYCGATSFVRS